MGSDTKNPAHAGSSQSVEVAFDKLVDDLRQLERIDDVHEVRKEGDKYRMYTDRPGQVASLVVEFAGAQNLKVLSLNTRGPRLEDVFVHLTCEKGELNAE